MKSGTSFFNSTLFKKNLTRYWPLWALYAIVWIYALPVRCMMVVTRNQAWMGETPLKQVQTFANQIPDLLEGFGSFMAFSTTMQEPSFGGFAHECHIIDVPAG